MYLLRGIKIHNKKANMKYKKMNYEISQVVNDTGLMD